MNGMTILKQWRNRDRGKPGHPTQFAEKDNSVPETELDVVLSVADAARSLDQYRAAPFLPDEETVAAWPTASDVAALTPRESVPVVARYRWFGGDVWVAGFNPETGVAFAYVDIPTLERAGWDYVSLRNIARDRLSLAERDTTFTPGTTAGECIPRYAKRAAGRAV